MVQNGFLGRVIDTGAEKPYEDYASLKKWLQSGRSGSGKKVNEWRFRISQATTNNYVDFEEKASQTITNLTAANATLNVSTSADDAYYTGAIVTVTGYTIAGVLTTSTATLTATNNATPVAFSPALALYNITSMTSSKAAQAGETITCHVQGSAGTVYATIQATASSAVAADLKGVGYVTIKGASDQAGDRSITGTLIYLTPWRELKTATFTTDASNSSTAVQASISTVVVNDFWRIRSFVFGVNATANIYTYAFDGTSILAVIKAANFQSLHSKFYQESGKRTFIAYGDGFFTGRSYAALIQVTLTPLGSPMAIAAELPIGDGLSTMAPTELKGDTDVTFQIKSATTDQSGTLYTNVFFLEVDE